MKIKKKLFFNSAALSGSQALARAFGFVFFLILARLLSVGDFGLMAWTLGFGYNFYPLADFGMERLALRYLSRHPEDEENYLAKLLPLRLWLAIAAVLGCLTLAYAIGIRGSGLWLLVVFELALLPYNLLAIIGAAENALEKPLFYAKATMGTSLLSGLFSIAVAWRGGPLWLILAAYFLADSLVLFWLWGSWKKLRVDWRPDWLFWRQVLRQAWVFAVLITLAVFYLRLPLILTGRLLGDYAAGIYGSVSKFVEAGIIIPQGITLAFFPISARLLGRNHRHLRRLYGKLWLGLLLFALPFSSIFIFAGRPLILIAYGSRYLPAVPVLQVLGIAILLFFVNALPGNIIHNSSRVKQFLPWGASNFLVMLLAGLYLIGRFGIIGAAWSAVVGEVYGLLINNFFVWRILREQ